jgi:hypothetical protein
MRAHTEEFSDTDPRVLEVWRSLIAAKTPGERIEMAFELSDFAIKMSESGLRTAALRIPRDLMIRAYGWDPETPFPNP